MGQGRPSGSGPDPEGYGVDPGYLGRPRYSFFDVTPHLIALIKYIAKTSHPLSDPKNFFFQILD